MKLFPDVSVQIPYDFVHFWDLSRSAVWNRSFRAIQVHKIKPKVTRQHFFFFAKRDFKIWKRPKYVTFFSIFLPIGSSLGCPTGYTQIGTSSCCRAGYSQSCNKQCARQKCENDSNFYWKNVDTSSNPFTCCKKPASMSHSQTLNKLDWFLHSDPETFFLIFHFWMIIHWKVDLQ